MVFVLRFLGLIWDDFLGMLGYFLLVDFFGVLHSFCGLEAILFQWLYMVLCCALFLTVCCLGFFLTKQATVSVRFFRLFSHIASALTAHLCDIC